MKYLFLLLPLIFPQQGQAFPEMVRHGYANCITCHVAPDGGGTLTAYGRSLSREVLSKWGAEGEEKWAYAVTTPEWLNLGGDVRGLQTYYNSSKTERARSLLMQADVEAAATIEKWTVDLSAGYQAASSANATGSNAISRRHYVMYRPTENTSLRLGRFQLPYGINLPDHFTGIKRGLKWDDGSESYNLEAAYLGENYDFFLTGTIGRPDNTKLGRDKGVSLRGSTFLSEKYKVGGSYFFGSSPLGDRHVVGPYAILGFAKDWYLLAEVDFQHLTPPTGAAKSGLVTYLKFDHEFTQGVHAYVTHEYSKLDTSKSSSESHAFGVGSQLFLRPHLELNLSFQKQQIRALGSEFADFIFVVGHLYL